MIDNENKVGIKQDLSSQEVYNILDKCQIFIENNNCSIIKKEYWGLKNLSYNIKDNKKGHYIMILVKSSCKNIIKIQNNFHISENIIKYIVLKVKNNSKK